MPYHRNLAPFLEVPVQTKPPGTVRFLIVAGLTTGKGVDTALRALAVVEPSAELVVVGDGPERESLEALADACRPHHRVQFRGTVSYEAVPCLMATADVLLFPSRHDGFGMVTMESLAAGRPVLASEAVMSAREYVRPGTNGWLLPVDDVPAWARRMESTIKNCDQLPAWSRAARETVCSRYRVENDVARLVDLLHDVRAPSAAPHG
jgi:glycosyltransferase involved in cell wall biosynthesis